MAKVKGTIKGPFNFVNRKGPFYINFKRGSKKQKDDGTLEVAREGVSTGDLITIAGILYGNEGLEFTMDIYAGDTKINRKPYKPHYDGNGRYQFNYVYGLP